MAVLKASVAAIQENPVREYKPPSPKDSAAKEPFTIESKAYQHLNQRFHLDLEKLRTELILFKNETKAVDLKQD